MTSEIPLFRVFMNPDININPILTSGYITQGEVVERYEEMLKRYFNYPFIVSVNSATSGLTLALRLLNLPLNSEIMCTPLTCLATNLPVLANHHTIKWVDVDSDTLNMDLYDLENKITENTRAVLFVHWGGYPLDLDKLKNIISFAEIKYGHKIHVIEDCAHAFGSKYKNGFLGTHENIAVYSTQAIKHLTTGDGGFMFLPDEYTYKRAKLLRWFGIDRERRSGGGDFRLEEDVKEWGYKFHMNDINASIGISNLPFINENIKKIRENAEYYKKELKDIPGVSLLKEDTNCESSYWLFTIKIINKREFIPFMKTHGVVVSQVHNRNDTHSCMSPFKTRLVNLDALEKEIVCIPCGWWVSYGDRLYIVDLIKEWCELHKIVIRELRVYDYEPYLNLLSQMNNFSYKISREQFERKLREISKQNCHIVVLEMNNKLIATGKILIEKKFQDSHAHIEDIVVDKDYRRMGYSKKILKRLLEISRENFCYKVSLCAKKNLSRVYESIGFIDNGHHFVMYL